MRGLLAILLCWIAFPAQIWGQEAEMPILQMELGADSAVPGQPIVLRVTVLTPTWFPAPPKFPSFEVPNVMVRLPPRGAGPTSRRIGGETWSGVTRAYRLYPMVAGRFRIPPRRVVVTYADPETRAPLTAELPTDEIMFSGVIPPEAAGLDPFIAADSLSLDQAIQGETQGLAPGGAVTRTVSARIDGTPAIFLPPLVPSLEGGGIAAYPDEPVVSESEQRGVLAGERIERVTYLAEKGGRFQAPAVSVRWFNLSDGTIDVAEVPGFEISVAAPPPGGATTDGRNILAWSIAGIAGTVVLAALARMSAPLVLARYRARRAAYLASEAFAFSQAVKSIRRQDFAATLAAVERWRLRLLINLRPDGGELAERLGRLGAIHYGPGIPSKDAGSWADCLDSLRTTRREALAAAARRREGTALPALNPGGRLP